MYLLRKSTKCAAMASLALAILPFHSDRVSSAELPTHKHDRHLVSSTGSERATSGAGGKIVTFAGKTSIVWQDATAEGAYLNRVRSFDHASETWSAPFTLNQGRDNHARPVLTVDEFGFLHVVLSGHNSAVTYRRSLRPNDASQWTEPESAASGTYPSLVAGKDGMLHLTLRNPRRWNGVDLHMKRRGGEWEKLCQLVVRDGKLNGYGAFHNGLAWGPNHKTLHLVQDFYESNDVMDQRGVHQAVCYMRSRDGGRTWEKTDNTKIVLPTRPEQMDILARSRGERHEPMPPPVILAQGSILVDADDRPHVLYISHLEKPGQAIHATTDDSGSWQQKSIDILADAYPNHRPIGCRGSWSIDSKGAIYGLLELVPYPAGWVQGKPSRAMKFSPTGKRLVWLISRDHGKSFTTTLALDKGSVFNQPNAERQTGFNHIRNGPFPPFLYFDGESRYREKGEVLQNNVFFVSPVRRDRIHRLR